MYMLVINFFSFMLQVRGVKGVFLANQKIDGKVATLITYNKGRDWDFLNPPDIDMNGKPTNCKPVSGPILCLNCIRIICMGSMCSSTGNPGALCWVYQLN